MIFKFQYDITEELEKMAIFCALFMCSLTTFGHHCKCNETKYG